ncbi:MAG TPA: EF-hand domain-containing protein [Methylocystis sp.]|jgi:Ca2+-binding EF-hand superfamily protein
MINGVYGVRGSYAPQMMSGASMRMPPAQKMANLFDKIDVSGTGSITKSQFVQAFQTMRPPASFKAMGADAIFSALDPNNSGSVSKQAFVQGMTNLMAQFRTANSSGA